MMGDLSCVYCPDDTTFRPTKIYILDGCSTCEACLRKIQTSYDQAELDEGQDYRPFEEYCRCLPGPVLGGRQGWAKPRCAECKLFVKEE